MTVLHYGEKIIPHRDGYAYADSLHAHMIDGKAVKIWKLGARVVSMQIAPKHGGGLWKVRERLDTEEPDTLLDSLERAGVQHPSSYGDCYHQLAAPVAPLRYTYNGLFSWWPGGPWAEARRTGEFGGTWHRYDLVSAYRWAATLGLPNPATYRVRQKYHSEPGLWVATINSRTEHLPAVFRTNGPVVVSTEEIEAYQLRVTVARGVTWRATMGAAYVEKTLQKLPCAKDSGRAYWGKWCGRDPLTCWTPKREWSMPNLHANFIWAWLVVGRVRRRVWEASRHAAHVYVDEVVVPHELPTSPKLGGWHQKETYRQGVHVVRTGAYGPRGGPFTMQTGVMSNGTN